MQNRDGLVERAFDGLRVNDLQFMTPPQQATDASGIKIGQEIAAVLEMMTLQGRSEFESSG